MTFLVFFIDVLLISMANFICRVIFASSATLPLNTIFFLPIPHLFDLHLVPDLVPLSRTKALPDVLRHVLEDQPVHPRPHLGDKWGYKILGISLQPSSMLSPRTL